MWPRGMPAYRGGMPAYRWGDAGLSIREQQLSDHDPEDSLHIL